jgi:hypothetical protein
MQVEQELRLQGPGIRLRHPERVAAPLLTRERLFLLEKATAQRKIDLTEERTRLFERLSREFCERHMEAPRTGRSPPCN